MKKHNNSSLMNDPRLFFKLFALLSLIAIVYCSGSAMGACYSGFRLPLLSLLFIAWSILVMHDSARKETFNSIGPFALVLVAAILFSAIFNHFSGLSSYLNALLTISVAAMIVLRVGSKVVIEYFIKTIYFLSVVSLLAYVVFYVFGISVPLPQMHSLSGWTTYLNGYLFCIDLSLNAGRNCGVFWEPSIFAGYINLAMLLIIIFSLKVPRRYCVVFAIAMITTMSTGGWICFLLVLAVAVYKRSQSIMASLSLAVVAAITWLNIDSLSQVLLALNYDVFYKIFGGADSATTLTRLECPVINLMIWMESPVFGSGFLGADTLYLAYRETSRISNLAQTSTTTYYLAALGVPGILFTVFWVHAIMRQKSISLISKFLSIAVVSFFLNEVPCTFFMALYVVMFALVGFPVGTECENCRTDVSRTDCEREGGA